MSQGRPGSGWVDWPGGPAGGGAGSAVGGPPAGSAPVPPSPAPAASSPAPWAAPPPPAPWGAPPPPPHPDTSAGWGAPPPAPWVAPPPAPPPAPHPDTSVGWGAPPPVYPDSASHGYPPAAAWPVGYPPAAAAPDGSVERPYPVGRRLGFADSLRSGWRLAGTCLRVLDADRELLLVPLVTLLAGLAVMVPYAMLLGGFDELMSGGKAGVVKLFPLFFVLSVLDVFGAATVVGAATIRLSGGNPTLTDGWVQALSRAPKLVRFAFAWAVQQSVSAWLRDRGKAGAVAADMLDTAWNVATFLAVPVLLFEPELSTTQAVRRSALLVGKRWGAGLVGNASLQLAVIVAGLPVVLGLTLVGSVAGAGGAVAGAVTGLLGVVAFASVLHGIFCAALYRFATTGLVAPGFRDHDMWQAFARPTKRR